MERREREEGMLKEIPCMSYCYAEHPAATALIRVGVSLG